MSKFTHAPLTAAQLRLWSETRVAMQFGCPAFTHVFYSLMLKDNHEHLAHFTPDVPRAATDGKRLLINPEWFFKLPLKKRVFVCLHEIGHAIFDHCGQSFRFQKSGKIKYPDGKELPYSHQLMNIATDLVINDMLIESKVGEFDKSWLHKPELVTHRDSSVAAYRKVYEDGDGGGSGESFDDHLEPGAGGNEDPHTADSQRNPIEWEAAVAAGAAAAKAQGKLPAAMELFIENLLTPVIDWTDRIQSFFARKVGSGSYDWRRPDRRLIVRDIYAPGRTGFGANLVVVAIDTSGSIICQPDLLNRFFSELAGVLQDIRPKRLQVMWIDAQVHAVDEVEDAVDLCALKPKGGGGTSFTPAFEYIEDNKLDPDCLVYLTDLEGSFPRHAPSYPVLWGTTNDKITPPFGDTVFIPT
jgi:predicted metal-dependent peptidase